MALTGLSLGEHLDPIMLICFKTLRCLQHVVDNVTDVWLHTGGSSLKFQFRYDFFKSALIVSETLPSPYQSTGAFKTTSVMNSFRLLIALAARSSPSYFYCNENLWENFSWNENLYHGCDSLHILSFRVFFFLLIWRFSPVVVDASTPGRRRENASQPVDENMETT